MTPDEWTQEAERLTWYGAFDLDTLLGVMGLEYVKDVALLRHAYILPDQQRHGIGSLLREYVEKQMRGVSRIVVGTYAGIIKHGVRWKLLAIRSHQSRRPSSGRITLSPKTGSSLL